MRYLLIGLLSVFLLASCAQQENKLNRVREAGELVVVTVNSPTTYYEGTSGFEGLEYDMAKAFADYLDVDLKILVVKQFADVIPAIIDGKADMAAAGITITDERKQQLLFSQPYQNIHQQLVYGQVGQRPRDYADLVGHDISVVAGTSYVTRLQQLKQQYPRLEWTESRTQDVGELLEMVWEGLLEYTVADSHIVTLHQQHYPELRVAFDMEKTESLAWAFEKSDDKSLQRAANEFMSKYKHSGALKTLLERYYGAINSNPVNMTIYRLRIRNRLPQYQTLFEEAAARNNLDWRLLAAIGYQESFWNPRAASPTGVRGIMMLTGSTAQHLGVRNRLDPEQSIDGGARYIREMYDRLPEEIQEPDRMWMALAAYNMGLHHLLDARIITELQGADKNKWVDVQERLPLLAQAHWYKRVEYGFARGWEPVRYINRIRSYYDVLRKIDDEEQLKGRHKAFGLYAPAI